MNKDLDKKAKTKDSGRVKGYGFGIALTGLLFAAALFALWFATGQSVAAKLLRILAFPY